MFYSHKEYGHERGLSCCFRQHRATHSHCSLLHGYALAVKLHFKAETLDDHNWVMDFGGLKKVEEFLKRTFDHKLVIARDDPDFEVLVSLGGAGGGNAVLADVVIMDKVGCEYFAQYIWEWVAPWVAEQTGNRVQLGLVTVKEHGANGASYDK